MRKGFLYVLSASLLLVLVSFCLPACKKNAPSQRRSALDGKLSFTYNGSRYVLPFKEGTTVWSVSPHLYINCPDLFGGGIHFLRDGCAYLEPTDAGFISFPGGSDANCELQQNGNAIDSAAVYLYQSGTFTRNWKNCYQINQFDIVSGGMITEDVCDVDGMFELTLTNSEGKTIIITNGTFEAYNVAR